MSDSQITVGIQSKELSGIIEAVTKDWRDLSAQQKQTIDDLKDKLGVNENALKAFFATLGEKDVPTDQLVKKLVEIAGSYKEALARAAPNPSDPPEIAKVKEAVKAALEAGQSDRADQLLAQLEKLEDAALASRQLERAGASAQRGQLAMSQLRYRDAARHFAEAASRVPTDRTDVRLSYLDQEANALDRQGDERGDNNALREAIERYRFLLTQRPRQRVPLEWAGTRMDLGNALQVLGERERGTAHLGEAVAAYRALQERTRERVPLEWAMMDEGLIAMGRGDGK